MKSLITSLFLVAGITGCATTNPYEPRLVRTVRESTLTPGAGWYPEAPDNVDDALWQGAGIYSAVSHLISAW